MNENTRSRLICMWRATKRSVKTKLVFIYLQKEAFVKYQVPAARWCFWKLNWKFILKKFHVKSFLTTKKKSSHSSATFFCLAEGKRIYILLKKVFFMASHLQSKNLKYLQTQWLVAEFFQIYKDEVIFDAIVQILEWLFVIVWCLF